MSENTIKIFTDGACKGNPGLGGWGALIIENGKEKEIYGGSFNTTNNKMELTATIEALKFYKDPKTIELYTDSNYLRQGITEWIVNWKSNNWRTASKKPVANRDLWIEVDGLSSALNIEWNWVKAHNGDKYNERADKLATSAI